MIFPFKPPVLWDLNSPGKIPHWVRWFWIPNLDDFPTEDFVDIKLDARNLIEADVKSALTDLDWFGKVGISGGISAGQNEMMRDSTMDTLEPTGFLCFFCVMVFLSVREWLIMIENDCLDFGGCICRLPTTWLVVATPFEKSLACGLSTDLGSLPVGWIETTK